jgi:hypothetical protein
MRITLRKYEAGYSCVIVRLASGLKEVSTIDHFKVDGFPGGQETSIALRGGRYNRHWENFQDGRYSGYYSTADEALAALQASLPN